MVSLMPDPDDPERDDAVRKILATSLDLAKELQRELGRLQQIVDNSLPPKDDHD